MDDIFIGDTNLNPRSTRKPISTIISGFTFAAIDNVSGYTLFSLETLIPGDSVSSRVTLKQITSQGMREEDQIMFTS